MKNKTMIHTEKDSPDMEEQKLPQKKLSKKWITAISAAAVLMVALIAGILAVTAVPGSGSYVFTLSQRDVAVELGETMQLEVVPDGECRRMRPEITWISSDPAVASVSGDGSVTALAGGESKITAIARYREEEYSVSCMVTVKAPGFEYSDYRLRWFTQSKDRRTYMVKEETFERLVGSEVELDEKYAMRMIPVQYVLNKEKSTWNGQVKELPGQCILEIYFDVAEIEYFVDCYYESDRKLGTYGDKETMICTAYAFSEVEASREPKEGFVLNGKNEDAVVRLESVETGARLSAYYDRIRSQATISYDTGRKTAVYTNVYGIGLLDAPADALTDSLEMYDVTSCCYINGERAESAEAQLKKATQDVSVHVKLEGTQGWFVEADGTLQNLAEWSNMPAFIFLKGSGSSLYLSATYDLTGSQTNMVGITLRSGGTSRELRFADRGVYIWKDQGGECGILNEGLWRYNDGGTWGEAFIWNQNSEGLYGTRISSVVNDMIKNPGRSSHDMVWAVQEGMLFCNIDGIPVLRIPLYKLDQEWTADKEYSIGFSAFDGVRFYNDLRIRNISVCYGEEARKHMYLGGQVEGLELSGVAYNVLTGSYLPSSVYGFNFLSGPKKIGNTGISADVRMLDMANSCSGYGVSVQAGDRSVQYIMQGNSQARRHDNAGWESMAYLRTMEQAIPFQEDGTSHIEAFVKDGYFYIMYNGVQAQCINMLAQFPDYDPETTAVSVGIASCDARLGLAEYRNVAVMSEKAVADAKSKLWGIYSELTTDAGPAVGGYSFAEGFFAKTEERWTVLPLMGTGKVWQIEGTMERTDSAEAELLRMGFEIQADGKDLRLLGNTEGIMVITNYGADWIGGYHTGVNKYVLNTGAGGFFREGRSKDKIDFKAVIYRDVFYLWMDETLCWRVPLTENDFGEDGSFAKGSGYQLSLMMGDGTGMGRMGNLKVRMSSQVTSQMAFLTDSDGKDYSFTDGIAMVESSLEPFLAFDSSGMAMDMEDGSFVASDTQWYDWIYGEAGAGDRGISADISWLDRKATGAGVGVIIKSGDKEHRFMNWSDENNYHLNIEHMISVGDQPAGGVGDIGRWTYENAPPFQADGSSHVEAFVKDGYFYIRYNGRQALCMSMVSLFSDYDPAISEVSVGVGGVAMNISQAKFANLTELDKDQVADITAEQWPYYAEGVIADDYNYKEGTFEKKTGDGWRVLPLGGSSKTWLVTGVMERTDNRSEILQMGFEVQCGEEKLRIMGQNYGMMPQYNWGYNEGVNAYVINTKAGSFFHDKAERISYQAAIYQDVLYVWFDGVLSWRVPLVNTKRDGGGLANFEPGSEYQLTLLIGQENALGRMADLDVKMGYQATGQTEFLTDSTGKSYSFQEALTAIEENLDIYLAGEHPYMMVEDPFGRKYATVANFRGRAYSYGKEAIGNQGMSADISVDVSQLGAGIVIRSGDQVHQFQAWCYDNNTKNWILSHTEGEGAVLANAWDYANILSLIPQDALPYNSEGLSHVDAFVKDGYFYICYNGKQALCLNMAALFGDYDPASSEVSLGIGVISTNNSWGQVKYSNVTWLSEEETAARAEAIGAVQRNFYIESVPNGCKVDLEKGTVSCEANGALKTVILPGSSKNWQVEGTIETTGRQWIGFGVEAGGNTLELLGFNHPDWHPNDSIFVRKNYGGIEWTYNTSYVLSQKAKEFFIDNGQTDARRISYKAVVAGDVLYVWFDGELCWQVPLSANEFGFNLGTGNEYHFMLTLGDWGAVKVSNLNVKQGSQVIPPAQTADFNAEAILLDGTVSNAEDPSVDGTVSDAEDTSEDGTATNAEDPPEDGTAANEEDPPEDGTAANEEDPSEDGTAANEENSPEDGTAANEENPPEDGTESDAEDTPEDGTESDEEDTPLDGKATNAEAIPPDGTATNEEDSPEDGTVSDSRRRIRRVFHRSDSDRLEFVLKKRIKKHEQV